jgi:hypothetical protein
MLKSPKYSKIEVVAPKEEEEEEEEEEVLCTCNIISANFHDQTAQYYRSNGFIISHSQIFVNLDIREANNL